MTSDDLKQIRGVVKEELEPVKKTLAEHTKILDQHTKILDQHTKILDQHTKILDQHGKKLDALWDQTAEITEDLTEIKITLKSHTADLDHTKKRVTATEDHLGI